MSSTYGVYGPPFEHVDNRQRDQKEEYAQNEKYEIRNWDWNDPTSLQPFMSRVNWIRDENPALQQMRNIRFHDTQNPEIIAFSKTKGSNLVVVVVTLDPHHPQEGQLQLPSDELGISSGPAFPVHDLLQDARYTWRGDQHFLRLTPDAPAHIFRIERDDSGETTHPVYDRLVHA
jgi:starch synthase (maltosyl-transferring)